MSLPDISPSPQDQPACPDDIWVICLCAEWCGVCRSYRTLFEQVAALFPQLRFGWLDVEDEAALVGDLDIETFPTLMVATSAGARFLGALTPHAQTLSRLLESLTDASADSGTVATAIDVACLVQTLQANPRMWVKN
jgi:thiol-disulfide isomerase/thioredoxin